MGPMRPHHFLHLLLFVLLFIHTPQTCLAQDDGKPASNDTSPAPSASPTAFKPTDNYLVDCGSDNPTTLDDGRIFKSDPQSNKYLSTNEDVHASVQNLSIKSPYNSSVKLYQTARIFSSDSKLTFHVSKTGWHFIRLYFYPLPHDSYDLKSAVFTVQTPRYVLLHEFSATKDSELVFKEYIVNANESSLSIDFKPKKGSFAFVNAIEFVSIPDELFSKSSPSPTSQGSSFDDLPKYAMEVSYRLNVGGQIISPSNDTLQRVWVEDTPYNTLPGGTVAVQISPSLVKYPGDGSDTPLIAPSLVYASAEAMQDPGIIQPNFNMTWKMSVDPSNSYLVRLHFCDIISKNPSDMFMNVYINGLMAVSTLDLGSKSGGQLKTAYFADFVVDAAAIVNGTVMIQVGSTQSQVPNATLNGAEIMKMSNMAGSLDGFYAIDGSYKGPSSSKLKILAGVGLGFCVTGMFCIGLVCVRWRNRPKDWRRRNSFSSWLLPMSSSQAGGILSSKSSSRRSSLFGSRKSKSHSSFLSSAGLGRFFSFSEIQAATQNFDDKAVIGVGGFGKVYIGTQEDGMKLAIKRGSSGSEQGINEFQTEIQMLSKLRHRHLVSLIGFCDENNEMILVYEYMANGPLRDHLYGSDKPTLSWKQRLEICIGAARGLHYLHTGTAQGIIHRDVKTTNILLDENFVAKMSDFGLSKAAAVDQGHVSTAVKGSFGYLDPEYFRRQQLTEKSDVYSFGVVLFEVLCARAVICPTLPREQVSLAEWAMQWHRKGMIDKIIDPKIAGTISEGSLKKFVEAAEKCLAEYGVDRPSMGDVLWNLEYALQLQEASLQMNTAEDKSKIMAFDDKGSSLEPNPAGAPDDSEVTVGTPGFSPAVKFQGR